MGHDKLRRFAENETFECLLQPRSEEIISDGIFNLHDHPVKGHWAQRMFHRDDAEIVLAKSNVSTSSASVTQGKADVKNFVSERYN